MEDRKGLGSRIRAVREQHGLTIEQAAEQCDASVSIWRQYERGERLPSLPRLKQMCIAFNQKPDYFFGTELDAVVDRMDGGQKVKAKIDQLLADELEIVDTLVTKLLEMRNR